MAFKIGDLGHVIEHNRILNLLLQKANTADTGANIAALEDPENPGLYLLPTA